jgi:2-dehydro-3-deoxy-L-rhamnonate dehydrogenase (NAD+)
LVDLSGKKAVVTGGARGVGRGIGQSLARRGCEVIIWDVATEGLTSADYGFEPALVQTVDVSDWACVEAAAEQLFASGIDIHILVNNAGISGPTNIDFWEYPVDAWNRIIDINLSGVFYCSRAFARHMADRGWGRIVNIASVSAKQGGIGYIGYSTAKGGVVNMTKCMGRELATTGVMVNAVTPAMIETELLKQMTPEHIERSSKNSPIKRFIQVDEVGSMVAWIASEECSATTGAVFDISGGASVY